jgi:hypothetical protein
VKETSDAHLEAGVIYNKSSQDPGSAVAMEKM